MSALEVIKAIIVLLFVAIIGGFLRDLLFLAIYGLGRLFRRRRWVDLPRDRP